MATMTLQGVELLSCLGVQSPCLWVVKVSGHVTDWNGEAWVSVVLSVFI